MNVEERPGARNGWFGIDTLARPDCRRRAHHCTGSIARSNAASCRC
ncbi:hypothetical protein [Burkholderia sp. A9]|nr:hypothetical protein [Burkholderia sp. A9]